MRNSRDERRVVAGVSHRGPAGGVEPVHDVCLVRPPEAPQRPRLDRRGADQLGHRTVRIPAAGAGQPHRVRGRRQSRAAEDHAGGHHAGGVRAVRGGVHAAAPETRLPVGRAVPGGRRVLHLPGMKRLRHIAIEGPIGAGKSTLASLLAPPLGAELVLERPHENPFLKDFYVDGPRYAFQTQLFFLFQRVELTRSLAQPGMFAPLVVSDFMLDKDRLFARLTLSDAEYRLYSMIHDQVAPRLPTPDLVIWLDGPMVVLRDRIRRRGRATERRIESEYLRAVADAYGQYFDTRTDLPLLVVDIDRFDPLRKPSDLQYLIERISRFEGPRE